MQKIPIQSSSIHTSAFVGVGSLRRSPPLHNALLNFQIEVQLHTHYHVYDGTPNNKGEIYTCMGAWYFSYYQ